MQPRPTTFRTVTIALVQILFLSVPKHIRQTKELLATDL